MARFWTETRHFEGPLGEVLEGTPNSGTDCTAIHEPFRSKLDETYSFLPGWGRKVRSFRDHVASGNTRLEELDLSMIKITAAGSSKLAGAFPGEMLGFSWEPPGPNDL